VERYQRRKPSSHEPLPPVSITIAPPPKDPLLQPRYNYLSLRIRDEGGGVTDTNLAQIFSYSFTTAGRNTHNANANAWDEDAESDEGGPYAAQYVGGSAAVDGGLGLNGPGLFGEITGRGVQAGVGTIAGLGYGLPMSRLYARYFGGSLDFVSLDGWGSDVFLKLRCLDDGEHIQI